MDEESETCALTAKNIKTSTLSLDTVAAFVQVMLREDLCLLFQWIQNGPPASDGTPTIQNGNNLTLEKNHQGWQESLSKWQSGVRKHSLNLYDLSYSLNFEAVVFYLYEVTWTFLNTRTCTYKKDDKPRSLYVYSSLCNPIMVGDQTTILLRQVPYQLLLTGMYSTYRGDRNGDKWDGYESIGSVLTRCNDTHSSLQKGWTSCAIERKGVPLNLTMFSSELQVLRRRAWKDPLTIHSLLSHLGFRIWMWILRRTKAQGRFQGQRIQGHLVISKRITAGVQAKKRYSPALLWGSSKH